MGFFKRDGIGDFYNDESIGIDVRRLRLSGLYTLAAVILAVPCFLIAGYDGYIYIVCLASIILQSICYIIYRYTNDATITSIIFCYMVNLVVIPLFFIYAGGIYGGMEFIFICGLIDGIFLMDGIVRLVSEIVFFLWYIAVIVYTYYNGNLIHNVPDGFIAVFSILMCITFTSFIFLVIKYYERCLLLAKQKSVEESVVQSIRSAETKSRFLSNVSHELRTPMNAIIGMSGIIQNSDTEGELTEEISIITRNARDLLSTINSILDYSRLESQKLTLTYDQFEFDTMMRELVSEASIRTEEKGIDFFVDIDPDSPNVLYGDYFQLEMILQDLIRDAIDSVSDGRVYFRIKGKFSKDKSKARFIAEISDTGEGISEEDLATIYSSFETYDSRQDSRIKRLGLKYSVFKGILKLMNGDFEIKSLRDVGTTIRISFEVFTVERIVLADKAFTIGKRVLLYVYGEKGGSYLEESFTPFGVLLDTAYSPDMFAKFYSNGTYSYIFISDAGYEDVCDLIKESDKSRTRIITDRMGTPADFGGLRIVRRPLSTINLSDIFFERWDDMDYSGEKTSDGFTAPDATILIVDDNMVNLKVAESMLSRYKITTRICESGYNGIEIMKSESFDMVFMDQVMPGMDGFEAMKLIRSSLVIRGARRIPIVCMTADSSADIREKVLSAGFNDFLSKPVKETELERILLTYLPDDKIRMSVPDAG
ncbi:MAG: response regulator [Lachnospiraceae bacterium]|nr:response regulator [Lachnospiraceae bacterium]